MRGPNDSDLRKWAKELDRPQRIIDGRTITCRWPDLVDALIAYRNRDTEICEPDGYPTTTEPGSRGGAELTPTEAAAAARIAGGHRDEFHHSVEVALDMLSQAFMSCRAVVNRLTLLDAMSQDAPEVPRWCEPCKAAGVEHTGEHYGTVGGRLTTSVNVCGPVYKYVRDHDGNMPTPEQLRHYDTTGRWKVRINPVNPSTLRSA